MPTFLPQQRHARAWIQAELDIASSWERVSVITLTDCRKIQDATPGCYFNGNRAKAWIGSISLKLRAAQRLYLLKIVSIGQISSTLELLSDLSC